MTDVEGKMMVGKHPMSPFGNTEAINDEEYWEDRAKRAEAALAESEKRAQAMAKIIGDLWNAGGMLYTRVLMTPASPERKRDQDYWANAVHAADAALGVAPPRSGPLTNHDYGDEDDARRKGRQ